MPAPRVSFPILPASYSRLPHDDESYVIRAYAKHSSHCSHPACKDPWKAFFANANASLCAKGQQRALDVLQYLFSKAGCSFSVIDLEEGRRMQVEIPAGYEVVRSLLRAVEGGMRVRHRQSREAGSYDRTYYVAPRRHRNSEEAEKEVHRPSSSSSSSRQHHHHHHHHHNYHHSPSNSTSTASSSHKSHYQHDNSGAKLARSASARMPTYYTIGSRGALPVLPRNTYHHEADWYH